MTNTRQHPEPCWDSEYQCPLHRAAPALLAALHYLKEHGLSPATWDLVNAALKKAEGK